MLPQGRQDPQRTGDDSLPAGLIGAVGGGIVGALIAGPVGLLLGALLGGAIASSGRGVSDSEV